MTQFQSSDLDGDQGGPRRPAALEPARIAFTCPCGRADCFYNRLVPLRDHAARLYRLLVECDLGAGAVLYPLQMVAGLEDLTADTSYVDDSMAIMMCRPAYEYEEAASDIASKYMAGATTFMFAWSAYEATVAATRPNLFERLAKEGRNGERGRRLLQEHPDEFATPAGVRELVRRAAHLCQKGGLFGRRLKTVLEKHTELDLVFAAELCRVFRNFFVHGLDRVPEPGDWHDGPDDEPLARCCRFHAISRLLLLLIQVFTHASIAPETMIDRDEEADGESATVDAREVAVALHLSDQRSIDDEH